MKPSDHVYVATVGSMTKLGVSNNPINRMKALRSFDKMPVALVKVWFVGCHALSIEAALKSRFGLSRAKGREYFNIDPENVVAEVERLLRSIARRQNRV